MSCSIIILATPIYLTEFSFSSFFDILNIWLKITRTPNRFEQTDYENKSVIRHEMGYKYSYLVKEVFRFIIEEGFPKSADYIHKMIKELLNNQKISNIIETD